MYACAKHTEFLANGERACLLAPAMLASLQLVHPCTIRLDASPLQVLACLSAMGLALVG